MPNVTLPADDGVRKNELLQWWYWTGHLESSDGRKFGFEIVFFLADVLANVAWGQMAQCAVSDFGANRFAKRQDVWPWGPRMPANAFDLATPLGEITAIGGDGEDSLHAAVDGYVLDLTSRALRPPTLHYGGGDHRYSFGGDTYYYSRPVLGLEGNLTLPTGGVLSVRGQGWFDRQFGELIPAVLVGWQWFAIQLAGNVQVMIFSFNKQPAELYGSITKADGSVVELGPSDITIEITAWWTSPSSGIKYPHGWTVTIPGQTLTITPEMDDQEMAGGFWLGPRYWEGACEVTGSTVGKAYVELVGFAYYHYEQPLAP